MFESQSGLDSIIIRLGDVVADSKLAATGNGRKHVATSSFPDEVVLDCPLWRVGSIYETGDGGYEIATLTERTTQDRHKHAKGVEIYHIIRGQVGISINDAEPYTLCSGDEIIVLPGTVHEIVGGTDLIARVHSFYCYGGDDKFVQVEKSGPWKKWSSLDAQKKKKAIRTWNRPN